MLAAHLNDASPSLSFGANLFAPKNISGLPEPFHSASVVARISAVFASSFSPNSTQKQVVTRAIAHRLT
jgi:hypothetical protein